MAESKLHVIKRPLGCKVLYNWVVDLCGQSTQLNELPSGDKLFLRAASGSAYQTFLREAQQLIIYYYLKLDLGSCNSLRGDARDTV